MRIQYASSVEELTAIIWDEAGAIRSGILGVLAECLEPQFRDEFVSDTFYLIQDCVANGWSRQKIAERIVFELQPDESIGPWSPAAVTIVVTHIEQGRRTRPSSEPGSLKGAMTHYYYDEVMRLAGKFDGHIAAEANMMSNVNLVAALAERIRRINATCIFAGQKLSVRESEPMANKLDVEKAERHKVIQAQLAELISNLPAGMMRNTTRTITMVEAGGDEG